MEILKSNANKKSSLSDFTHIPKAKLLVMKLLLCGVSHISWDLGKGLLIYLWLLFHFSNGKSRILSSRKEAADSSRSTPFLTATFVWPALSESRALLIRDALKIKRKKDVLY